MGEGRGETQGSRKEERGEAAGKRGEMCFIFNEYSQTHEPEYRRTSEEHICTHTDTLQNMKFNGTLTVCAEGRGKTEAAEKATGASEASLSTLPQKLAATARPGAMETPHSA